MGPKKKKKKNLKVEALFNKSSLIYYSLPNAQ